MSKEKINLRHCNIIFGGILAKMNNCSLNQQVENRSLWLLKLYTYSCIQRLDKHTFIEHKYNDHEHYTKNEAYH